MTRNAAGGRKLTAGLALAAALLGILSLTIGAARLSPHELFVGLVQGDGVPGIILRDIRLPRVILSLSIGAMLGLAGAAMQGLLRNPLAEPAVFGAPQAAALGAVAVLYLGLADAFSLALPLAAISGAALATGLVLALAGREANLVTLILSGLAISSLAGAATSLVINLSPNPFAVTEIVFWLMGSFEDRSMRHALLALPFIALAMALLFSRAGDYRALALGDDTAQSLGVDLTRLRLVTVGAVALGVGAGVAVSGAIGFVGLVAPHIIRPFYAADPGRILLPSALLGACLLTLADIAVRLIPATSEIKVGVLTAILGVPVFLYLVISQRAFFGGAR